MIHMHSGAPVDRHGVSIHRTEADTEEMVARLDRLAGLMAAREPANTP